MRTFFIFLCISLSNFLISSASGQSVYVEQGSKSIGTTLRERYTYNKERFDLLKRYTSMFVYALQHGEIAPGLEEIEVLMGVTAKLKEVEKRGDFENLSSELAWCEDNVVPIYQKYDIMPSISCYDFAWWAFENSVLDLKITGESSFLDEIEVRNVNSEWIIFVWFKTGECYVYCGYSTKEVDEIKRKVSVTKLSRLYHDYIRRDDSCHCLD